MTTRIALTAAALLATPVFAGDDVSYVFKSLTVGDTAPNVQIAHWLKGTPVTAFEQGKVYVVEFWATWCGPCRASVPHIAKLQETYKDYDVTIIGISDEKLPIVVEFMTKADSEEKTWFTKMGYTIATDPDRSVYLDYMTSSGNTGIPTAFIVGKSGEVEWIGHPNNIDEPLEAVVKDDWDRATFRAEWEDKMAEKRSRMAPQFKYSKARTLADWPVALDAVGELIENNPKSSSYKIQKFLLLVRDLDKPEEGYAYGRKLAQEYWDSPSALNALAWHTLDTAGIKTRDLKFALKFALRASELTDNADAAILDTVARAYFERGNIEKALYWQRQSVENATGEGMKHELNETLIKYEKAAG